MPAPHELPISAARAVFGELVRRAQHNGDRIVLTRHGKAVAAIVSVADLDDLLAMDKAEDAAIAGALADDVPEDRTSGDVVAAEVEARFASWEAAGRPGEEVPVLAEMASLVARLAALHRAMAEGHATVPRSTGGDEASPSGGRRGTFPVGSPMARPSGA